MQTKHENNIIYIEKGSITVESCIILPLVFLVVISLIYMSLLLYERVVLQCALNNGIKQGKTIMENTGAGHNLYWRLYDKDRDAKIEAIRQATFDYLYNNSILRGTSDKSVDIGISNYLLYKKINICIESSYYLPAGGLLGKLGLKEYFKMQAEGTALIKEPVEFIRNTDFALEAYNRVKESYPYLEKVDKKMQDIFEGILNRINSIFY